MTVVPGLMAAGNRATVIGMGTVTATGTGFDWTTAAWPDGCVGRAMLAPAMTGPGLPDGFTWYKENDVTMISWPVQIHQQRRKYQEYWL